MSAKEVHSYYAASSVNGMDFEFCVITMGDYLWLVIEQNEVTEMFGKWNTLKLLNTWLESEGMTAKYAYNGTLWSFESAEHDHIINVVKSYYPKDRVRPEHFISHHFILTKDEQQGE